MNSFVKLKAVMELVRDQELGLSDIPTQKFQIVIDLDQVEAYRQDSDMDGTINDYTRVEMRSGFTHCIDLPFNEFDQLMDVVNIRKRLP